MEGGVELDILIAEKVLGIFIDYENSDLDTFGRPCVIIPRAWGDETQLLPEFSTNIADAWLVVEKMLNRGFFFQVSAQLGSLGFAALLVDENKNRWHGYGKTAPLAICLSALNARGITPDTDQQT